MLTDPAGQFCRTQIGKIHIDDANVRSGHLERVKESGGAIAGLDCRSFPL
jgi:hypothetical protein